MSLHTRAATEDDVYILEQIMRDAFEASHAHFMPEQYVREWYDNKVAEKVVRSSMEQTGVVEIMGRVIGFVIYKDNHVEELWVDPQHQEQGGGRALIEWVEAQYRTMGYPTLTLYVYEGNVDAMGFCKQMRFRKASQFMSNDVAGGPIVVYNMLKMVKNLKR